jgi:Arc/MetJ family transcription regulator
MYASNGDLYDASIVVEVAMRTTVTLDDELLARAEELTGIRERSALIRDAVELLVRIETGRQLAALGGSDQAAEAAPRSRKRA